jgi:TonB family protein
MSDLVIARPDTDPNKSTPFGVILTVSVLFHLVLIVGIPLLLKLTWKSTKFERPATFQLVSPVKTTPQRRTPVSDAPKQKMSRNEVKPAQEKVPSQNNKPVKEERTKPQKEPIRSSEESLDELESVLNEMPAPALVSAVSDFKYHWYLNSVQQKLERYWNPPSENREIKVIVSFTIFHDGSVSEPSIKRSSGNSSIDNLAIRAVKLASPFGKLPPGFTGDRLDLNCTLIPTRK